MQKFQATTKDGKNGMAWPDKFSASKKGWVFQANGSDELLMTDRELLSIPEYEAANVLCWQMGRD